MALQLGDTAPDFQADTTEGQISKHQVATPVNWKRGEDVIIVPAVSDEDARKKYPAGFTTVKPYLRTVAQPQG